MATEIIRRPRKWATQRIFFDVVVLNGKNIEHARYATFICQSCRDIADWDSESEAYRCNRCGKKISLYGAMQIVERYEEQFSKLKRTVKERMKNATDD